MNKILYSGIENTNYTVYINEIDVNKFIIIFNVFIF